MVFEELQPSTNGVFTIGALFASQAGYDLTDLHLAGRFGNDGINPAVGNRLCSMPGVLKKAGYFLSFDFSLRGESKKCLMFMPSVAYNIR